MRKQLPKNISNEMNNWRAGLASFPQSYIDFHHSEALADLTVRENWKVLESELKSDGWGDGARFLAVSVAIRDSEGNWEVKNLQWHESFAWFEKHDVGGSSRFAEAL